MLRVFGPARIDGVHDGHPLGARRQRQVLAALATRPGRMVQVETLADWVWGDDTPDDPSAAIQTLVHRLRRTLGEAAGIETRGTAYLLLPPDTGVDVVVFEECLRGARGADPHRAVDLLTTARACGAGSRMSISTTPTTSPSAPGCGCWRTRAGRCLPRRTCRSAGSPRR